ncbi:MAG: hypothetical protein U0401_03335 [Anaerolineae bacterium]
MKLGAMVPMVCGRWQPLLSGLMKAAVGAGNRDDFEQDGTVIRPVAQMSRHRQGVNDVAGVEQVVRVKSLLDLPVKVVQFLAVEFSLNAETAIAVSLVITPPNSPTNSIEKAAICGILATSRQFGVDERADVQTSGAGVSVASYRCPPKSWQTFYLGDVFSQVFHRHGGIFNERDGLDIALEAHQQSPGPLCAPSRHCSAGWINGTTVQLIFSCLR